MRETLDFGPWTPELSPLRCSMNSSHSKVLVFCLFISLPVSGLSQSPSSASHITIDAQKRFQVIDGFGVNFNGTYFREAQKPMIDLLIDDLGATIFRLDPYGLLNWEAVNDNDSPQVMNWEYYNDRYSIATFEASWAAGRYLNSRGIRPFLALSGIAPDWMLDSNAPPPQHKVCGDSSGMGHAGPMKPNHLNPDMYG